MELRGMGVEIYSLMVLLGQVLFGAYIIGWLYGTYGDWRAFSKGPERGEKIERLASWGKSIGLSLTFMELTVELPYVKVRTMSVVMFFIEYKLVKLSTFKSYK